MPSQQPQVSVVQPQVLVVMSSSSLHLDFKFAVLGIGRVVVELRDFVHPHWEQAVFEFVIGRFKEPVESRHRHAFDARNGLGCRDDFAQENSFAERQIVRLKKSGLATGQNTVAEHVEQRRLDVGAQISGSAQTSSFKSSGT